MPSKLQKFQKQKILQTALKTEMTRTAIASSRNTKKSMTKLRLLSQLRWLRTTRTLGLVQRIAWKTKMRSWNG